ncbi:MAG: PhnD/SsuA/transferrin family substrate-binding protein [Lachnospiraceae bacterium]|nr:PhnD/SsuA/transferrin family substrate-binding protein [Lachnospiraceae bacterium]
MKKEYRWFCAGALCLCLWFIAAWAVGFRRNEEEKIPLFVTSDAGTEKAAGQEGKIWSVAFAALVSPQESYDKYRDLIAYLEERMGGHIEIVLKQTYDEVNDMLAAGEVDFGFICSLSYVIGKDEGAIVGIATPVIRGEKLYRSYTICRKGEGIETLQDLKGRVFAFTDPLSYTGHLTTLSLLWEMGIGPEEYFTTTYYTYSHDYSIRAVHLGIADAASVDGLIYDETAAKDPDAVSNLMVLYDSDKAGMPPVVASGKTDEDSREAFQKILFAMDKEEEGRRILAALGIDRYEEVEDADYDIIRRAQAALPESWIKQEERP